MPTKGHLLRYQNQPVLLRTWTCWLPWRASARLRIGRLPSRQEHTEEKNDEFVYDVDKAVKGHLPLTSALRGTQLLEGLMDHKAWDRPEFN